MSTELQDRVAAAEVGMLHYMRRVEFLSDYIRSEAEATGRCAAWALGVMAHGVCECDRCVKMRKLLRK